MHRTTGGCLVQMYIALGCLAGAYVLVAGIAILLFVSDDFAAWELLFLLVLLVGAAAYVWDALHLAKQDSMIRDSGVVTETTDDQEKASSAH